MPDLSSPTFGGRGGSPTPVQPTSVQPGATWKTTLAKILSIAAIAAVSHYMPVSAGTEAQIDLVAAFVADQVVDHVAAALANVQI